MENDQTTISGIVEMFLAANKMLAEAILQLSGRFDALKNTVCELHPEIATQLEERIRKEQSDSLRQFSELQRKLEVILPTLSKSVH